MDLTRPIGLIGGEKVFVSDTDGESLDALRLWASAGDSARLLQRLSLNGDEGLLVARNGLLATFRAEGIERHVGLVDALVNLAESLPPNCEPEEVARLPDGLSSLRPLIGRWAIGDDQQRADVIEAADADELRSLAAAVEPHLATIDELFATDEFTRAAQVTGQLAEAAIEARRELERRGI